MPHGHRAPRRRPHQECKISSNARPRRTRDSANDCAADRARDRTATPPQRPSCSVRHAHRDSGRDTTWHRTLPRRPWSAQAASASRAPTAPSLTCWGFWLLLAPAATGGVRSAPPRRVAVPRSRPANSHADGTSVLSCASFTGVDDQRATRRAAQFDRRAEAAVPVKLRDHLAVCGMRRLMASSTGKTGPPAPRRGLVSTRFRLPSCSANAAASTLVNAARLRLRLPLSANCGSSASSGRPMISAILRNCPLLPDAMKMSQVLVGNLS